MLSSNSLGLAVIIGHIGKDNSTATDSPLTLNPGPRRELDYWRLDIPDTFAESNSILHLCYWHVTILDSLDVETTQPQNLQEATERMVNIIVNAKGVASALIVSVSALLVLTLIELLRHEDTKQSAERDLKVLREGRYIPSGWDSIIRKMVEANTQTDFDDRRLQQLAEAASGKTGGSRDVGGSEHRIEPESATTTEPKNRSSRQFKELRALAKSGFLSAFSDDLVPR